MKTYLEKIHESEVYALDQTIKVWTKILNKKDALMEGKSDINILKYVYSKSTIMRGDCILCEHYDTCEECVLKSCYRGEAIYANIVKAVETSDPIMFVCYVKRLISKCYARIRELTEIRQIELCIKYNKEFLCDEENALITAIDMYLYLQYHTDVMLQYKSLGEAKENLFPFAKWWNAVCPLCEYYDKCSICPLRSCTNGSAYVQICKGYVQHDLHKFVSGCAEIINRCYNRLEELEERA